jgi:two-component system, chemotaxis family, protein-glutamate methylesterase/glutaminase
VKTLDSNAYDAVTIGASAGGMSALSLLLPVLPENFPAAIIIINHRMSTPDTYLTEYLSGLSKIPVTEAEHLQTIKPSTIYIAPPGYHLLIADDYCFNLTVDDRVNSSRPSIDVTFETAAEVYREKLIGVILTGANSDGAAGLAKIKQLHGYTIAQDPSTAESAFMPNAAIMTGQIDFVGSLMQISQKLCELCGVEANNND